MLLASDLLAGVLVLYTIVSMVPCALTGAGWAMALGLATAVSVMRMWLTRRMRWGGVGTELFILIVGAGCACLLPGWAAQVGWGTRLYFFVAARVIALAFQVPVRLASDGVPAAWRERLRILLLLVWGWRHGLPISTICWSAQSTHVGTVT